MTVYLSSFASLALCLAFPSTILAGTVPRLCRYRYDQVKLFVTGGAVTVERYMPISRKRHALVFMLHGSAGAYTIAANQEPPISNFGEKDLAEHCFIVFFPHYFEASGRSSIVSVEEMTASFKALSGTANELLDTAEKIPEVRGQPVFLFGESLGAYLAITLSLERSEIRAVSEISGGIANEKQFMLKSRTLSVMISHGMQDLLVSVGEAYKLQRYCLRNKLEVRMKLYENIGHYFPEKEEQQCVTRTIVFFNKKAGHS